MKWKVWAVEIRAPFLLLPVILSILGAALAYYQGYFESVRFIIFTVILVLLHITVNTLNEYYDHLTGIDFETKRTMFNGGSGILQQGLLKPAQVRNVALGSFVLAFILSLYLLDMVGIRLLPILLLGMIFALFYTQIFARNMMGEISAGLGLGALPVLGAFLVQIEVPTISVWLLALASGILTFNLLLLNEFPDQYADQKGGRRNLVIFLGEKRSASLFTLLTISVYAVLVIGVLMSHFPYLAFLGLLTLPLAYKASKTALYHCENLKTFSQGQGANVQMILATQFLISVGLIISLFTGI